MAQKDIIYIIQKYYEAIRGNVDVKRIMLFGSTARGTDREDSDIDVAVFVEKAPQDYYATLTRLYTIGRTVNTRIEPHLLINSEPIPLTRIVEESGIEIPILL
jgi:predicted nucleotidyltransferase